MPKLKINLGFIYFEGRGVTKDYTEAVKWYRMAAEAGIVEAQNNLGFMYSKGHGISKDIIAAYMWFSLAAAQGYENAAVACKVLALDMLPEEIIEAESKAQQCFEQTIKTAISPSKVGI